MNQFDVENINSGDINQSDKNKKTTIIWQILFLIVVSVVAVLFLIDILSGILEAGMISYSCILLIPTMFAFPIAIKKPILLLIPSVIFPLTVIVVSAYMTYFSYVLFYCLLLAFMAVPGIAVGILIRLSKSKRRTVRTVSITIGIISLVTFLAIVAISISNPLRKSNEQIRESILELTPIGTNIEEVIAVIDENELWYKNYKYNKSFGKYKRFDRGYLIRNDYPQMYYQGFENIDEADIVGKETIKAPIGTYINFNYIIPFDTSVYVFWAFDENSNLVGIAIMKETDGF